MGPAILALYWLNLVVIFRSSDHILVVTVALVDIVFLADALTVVPPTQPSQEGGPLFTISALVHPHLLLFLILFVDELSDDIIFTEPFEGFSQFLRISIDEYLPCFPMFADILVEFFDAVLVNLAVIGEVGDESGQAIFPLEDVDLVMEGFYLLADELRDVDGFFFIVDFHILVLVDRLDV